MRVNYINVLLVLACASVSVFAQRLPRPIRIHVTDRTETSCALTWSNPPGMNYVKFDIYVYPKASVVYPRDRTQTLAHLESLQPGVTYSVRLRGKTATKRSSTPTSFNLWSQPPAPTGVTLKPLEDLRLKISLGSESQDFTAKIVGALVEWNPVKLDHALLGYETEIYPDDGMIVYPDDMDKKESAIIYTSLVPGKEYTVTVRTKIGPPYAPVYSAPVTSPIIMPPKTPFDVKVNAIGGSYVTFGALALMGESESIEFDIEPPHGEVGDGVEDPVQPSYKLYTINKLQPDTEYTINAYATSHGIRSSEPFTLHVTTEPAGKLEVGVHDFTSFSVTLSMKEKRKSEEEEPEEYSIQYNNVDDPESYIETEKFTQVTTNSIINVKVSGLSPGMTYRFGVIKSPSGDAEFVGEVVQTTIPLAPILVSHELYEEGVKVIYGAPDEGQCPTLKVYTSPGPERYNYRAQTQVFYIGEPVYLPEVPTTKRYTVHARCVSSGVEGVEVTFDSFKPALDETRSPKLACQEIKEEEYPKYERSEPGEPRFNSTAKPNACCGRRPYNTEHNSCCGDYLLKMGAEPKKLCCGDYPYIVSRWVCCEGSQILPRSAGCES